jgi:serine/threonine protein kinase
MNSLEASLETTKRILFEKGWKTGEIIETEDNLRYTTLKRFPLGRFSGKISSIRYLLAILREIKISRHVTCPGVLRMYYGIPTQDIDSFNCVDLVYESVRGGRLTPFLAGPTILSDDAIRSWMLSLLLSLEALHGHGISPENLRADNCFLMEPYETDKIPEIKIGDFGLKEFMNDSPLVTPPSIALLYTSPEVFNEKIKANDSGSFFDQKKLDFRKDVWSLGVIFAKMIPRSTGSLRRPPFIPTGPSEKHMVKAILVQYGWSKGKTDIIEGDFLPSLFEEFRKYSKEPSKRSTEEDAPSPANAVHPDAIDMLEKMLCFNLKNRWSCFELLNHPYMTDDSEDIRTNCPHFVQLREKMRTRVRPPVPKRSEISSEIGIIPISEESKVYQKFNFRFDDDLLMSPFIDYNVMNVSVGPVPEEASELYSGVRHMIYSELLDISNLTFGSIQRPFCVVPEEQKH